MVNSSECHFTRKEGVEKFQTITLNRHLVHMDFNLRNQFVSQSRYYITIENQKKLHKFSCFTYKTVYSVSLLLVILLLFDFWVQFLLSLTDSYFAPEETKIKTFRSMLFSGRATK